MEYELIQGEGGKGGAPTPPRDASDNITSKQQVKLLFVVSEGEIQGVSDIMVNGASYHNYTTVAPIVGASSSGKSLSGAERWLYDANWTWDTLTALGDWKYYIDRNEPRPVDAPFYWIVFDTKNKRFWSVSDKKTGLDQIANMNKTALDQMPEKLKISTVTGFATQKLEGFEYLEAPLEGAGDINQELIGATSGTNAAPAVPQFFVIPGTATSIRFIISLAYLWNLDKTKARINYKVEFKVYVRNTTGSYSGTQDYTISLEGKCSTEQSFDSVDIKRPTSITAANENTSSWEVMIIRATDADLVESNIQTTGSKSFLRQVLCKYPLKNTTYTYPGKALVGVDVADASHFGNKIPTLKFKVDGIILPLPTGCTPYTSLDTDYATRTTSWRYPTTWDFTFTTGKIATSNPAWILYHILINTTWGLSIDETDVDKGAFYSYAKYCDFLVPTGLTDDSKEPRYSFHNQFIKRESVHTFLTSILSIGNANLVNNEFGQISVIWDRAGQPITKIVSNATVVDGMFTYSSTDLENRTTKVNVTYARDSYYGGTDTATAPDLSSGNDPETIALQARYGIQTADLVLVGCTSPGQATRKARWALYNNCYCTELITFKQFFYGATYHIGELVSVKDSDNLSATALHAIVSGSSVNTANHITYITLDRKIAAPTTGVLTVDYIAEDGITVVSGKIVTPSTTQNIVSIAEVVAQPAVNSTIVFHSTEVKQKVYKITSIDKDDDHIYTISGVIHHEEKYNYIDNLAVGSIPTTPVSSTATPFVNSAPPSVTDVGFRIVNRNVNGNLYSDLEVFWKWNSDLRYTNAVYFGVSVTKDTEAATVVEGLVSQSYTVSNAKPGLYTVKIWAMTTLTGLRSAVYNVPTYAFKTTVGSSTLLPPLNVRVDGAGDTVFSSPTVVLTWDKNAANDDVEDTVAGYLVELWTDASPSVLKYSEDLGINDKFSFNLTKNIATFGTATPKFLVKVYSKDQHKDLSLPYVCTVENIPPVAPTFNINSTLKAVIINVTSVPSIDTAGYIVYRGTTANFTTVGTLSDYEVYRGVGSTITLDIPDTVTYYYAIAEYDTFGTVGALGVTSAMAALAVDNNSWTLSGIDFVVEAGTKTINWVSTGGKVIKNGSDVYNIVSGSGVHTSGTLFIYFNPAFPTVLKSSNLLATAVASGNYPIAAYAGGDASTLKGGTGEAFISGSQIIAGTVGASQIAVGSITADKLVTDTALITNKAQFGDVLESDNYSPTTGWRISKSGVAEFTGVTLRSANLDSASQVGGVSITALKQSIIDSQNAASNAANAAATAQTSANTALIDANTAKTDASTAKTDASAAKADIVDMSSDSKITASEKSRLFTDWKSIYDEYPDIVTKASDVGVSSTVYATAYSSLSSYLTAAPISIDAAPTTGDTWCASQSVITIASAAGFRTKFNNYYNTRQLLLNAIAKKAKDLADAAQGTANSAASAASAAAATANAAATSVAYKMDASAVNVLSGSGTIQVGDLTNGLVISTGGLLGRKAGVTTFSIDTTGTAVFAGSLVGATGWLDDLYINGGQLRNSKNYAGVTNGFSVYNNSASSTFVGVGQWEGYTEIPISGIVHQGVTGYTQAVFKNATTEVKLSTGSYAILATGWSRFVGNATVTGDASIGGNLTATGNVTAYSDARLKTNLKPLTRSIDSLTGYSFNWNGILDRGDSSHSQDIGLLADEVELVLPEAVFLGENGYKTVDYTRVIPLLVEELKALKVRVKGLEDGISK
jgi:hypothetical protein